MNIQEKAIKLIMLLGGPSNIRRVDVVLSGVDGLIFVINDTPDVKEIKALDGVIDVKINNTIVTVSFGEKGESRQLLNAMDLFFQLYDRSTQ